MTLTQTAILVKQTVVVSALALILGLGAFVGYKIWMAYYISHLPTVEEKPDLRFGLLPPPDFPKSHVSSSNFSYSLDTTTGGLPKVGQDPGFEKFIKVYFVTQTFASFLSPQRSEDLAAKLGITVPAEILTETKYKFTDNGKTLLVDLNSGNFSYAREATISANLTPDNDDKILSDFKRGLSSLGALKDNLANGTGKVILLKYVGSSFIPTRLASETQAVQVSLWPAPIDRKPIYTDDFYKSLVTAIVVGNASDFNNYISLNFTDYPIDTSTFATYPIKTAETAFDDLKNGKGAIIVEPARPQVSITAVSLAYFLSENYSPYLQPIFVFEGPSFVAYVSAVNEQFQTLKATQN